MKKKIYNHIISIGESCSCATILKNLEYRNFSAPFDWIWGASLDERINLILDDFKDYLLKDEFSSYFVPNSANDIYINNKTQIRFNHDFPKGSDFSEVFPKFKEKYERRIARLLNIIKSNKRILFVYLQSPNLPGVHYSQENDDEKIKQVCAKLYEKYPNIDILFIKHNENLKRGQNNIEQISANLYFGECFNYNKKKILTGNNVNPYNATKIIKSFAKLNFQDELNICIKKFIRCFYTKKNRYVRILCFKFLIK